MSLVSPGNALVPLVSHPPGEHPGCSRVPSYKASPKQRPSSPSFPSSRPRCPTSPSYGFPSFPTFPHERPSSRLFSEFPDPPPQKRPSCFRVPRPPSSPYGAPELSSCSLVSLIFAPSNAPPPLAARVPRVSRTGRPKFPGFPEFPEFPWGPCFPMFPCSPSVAPELSYFPNYPPGEHPSCARVSRFPSFPQGWPWLFELPSFH